MNLPSRRSPAPLSRVLGEGAIVCTVGMNIVEHQLSNYLHLLAPLSIKPRHRPLWVSRMRCHFRDDTCLFGGAGILWIVYKWVGSDLLCQSWVEADP